MPQLPAMLHYEVHGNTGGPTVALLHGFMSSNTQWEPNVERLAADFRLVLIELMGHGSSPAPEDPELYSRDAVLGHLESIRKEIAADTWWIGGHSLGGATAIRYALAHPDRSTGLIFTNTRAAFGNRQAGRDVVERVSRTPDDLRELPYHPIHAKRFPEATKARMVEIADRMMPHALANTVAHRHDWSSAMELHQLTMPVLLINGRFESAFQPYVEVAEHTVPDLSVVSLDGGHSINLEQPEAFDAAVRDFVIARVQGANIGWQHAE